MFIIAPFHVLPAIPPLDRRQAKVAIFMLGREIPHLSEISPSRTSNIASRARPVKRPLMTICYYRQGLCQRRATAYFEDSGAWRQINIV